MSDKPPKNSAEQPGDVSSSQSYYSGQPLETGLSHQSYYGGQPVGEEPLPPPRPPAPPPSQGGESGRFPDPFEPPSQEPSHTPRPPAHDSYEEKWQSHGEKDEKDEKDEKEEKDWDEKVRRDPLDAITWAAIIMWVGVAFLMANLGILDDLFGPIIGPNWLERANLGWGVAMLGAGLILLLEVVVRLLFPQYARSVTGTVLLAIIFIGIGLGNLFSWAIAGPLMLIVIGAWLLWRGFRRPRSY